jgi:hypothetical protein
MTSAFRSFCRGCSHQRARNAAEHSAHVALSNHRRPVHSTTPQQKTRVSPDSQEALLFFHRLAPNRHSKSALLSSMTNVSLTGGKEEKDLTGLNLLRGGHLTIFKTLGDILRLAAGSLQRCVPAEEAADRTDASSVLFIISPLTRLIS